MNTDDAPLFCGGVPRAAHADIEVSASSAAIIRAWFAKMYNGAVTPREVAAAISEEIREAGKCK